MLNTGPSPQYIHRTQLSHTITLHNFGEQVGQLCFDYLKNKKQKMMKGREQNQTFRAAPII